MQTIEKFIINRNDIGYFYVEKRIGNFNNVQYFAFFGKNYEVFSEEGFEITFPSCKKESIKNYTNYKSENEKHYVFEFVNFLERDLTSSFDYDQTVAHLYGNIDILKKSLNSLILKGSEKNPSLWGCKETLVETVKLYNDILPNRVFDEIDHEKEIDRINDNDSEDILIRLLDDNKVA